MWLLIDIDANREEIKAQTGLILIIMHFFILVKKLDKRENLDKS
jgi:hypothetical protein